MKKVPAWLTAENGKSYQLYANETFIGRLTSNEICLMGDETVSRLHAKITESDGRFKLYDLGSTSFTRVNGKVVRAPVLLENGDDIQFGKDTVLRFVSANR